MQHTMSLMTDYLSVIQSYTRMIQNNKISQNKLYDKLFNIF